MQRTLFKSILRNAQHVLQPYLEERPPLHYNLRNRPGINKTLIQKTVDLSDFLVHSFAVCIKSAMELTASYICIITAFFNFSFYATLRILPVCPFCYYCSVYSPL